MARKPAKSQRSPSLKALTAKRERLQESLRIGVLERTQKLLESYVYDDFGTTDLWDRTRGRSRAGRRLPPSGPHDRQGGRNYPLWHTQQELDDLRQNSRVSSQANSYTRGLLRNLCGYVVGDGFDYKAVPIDQRPQQEGLQKTPDQDAAVSELQKWIDGWLARNRWSGDPNPLDTKAIAATREREAFKRMHRDGEVFVRLFFNADGTTDVRFVEPEQIRNPSGATYEQGWSFGIRHHVDEEKGWHDVERVVCYHVVYPDNLEGEDVPANEIVHIKNIEDDAAIARGTPTFSYDTLAALERAAKVQRNASISAQIRAATAEIWEHNFGSKADIQAMATSLAAQQIEDPERSPNALVNLEYLDPGAIRRIPEGQKLIQPPTTTGVPEHLQAAQGDLRQAGAAVGAPEYLISADASNANYASTKEAGTPFVVGSEAEQNHFRTGCLAVMYRSAEHAREKGRLPENIWKLAKIQAEAPKVKQRDPLQAAQEAQILNMLGLSNQTILMEHGYDVDTEKQNTQEWRDEMGGGGQPFPMPGQGDGQGGGLFAGMESQDEIRRFALRLLREGWDESKHKRDKGKFSKTEGADKSEIGKSLPKERIAALKAVHDREAAAFGSRNWDQVKRDFLAAGGTEDDFHGTMEFLKGDSIKDGPKSKDPQAKEKEAADALHAWMKSEDRQDLQLAGDHRKTKAEDARHWAAYHDAVKERLGDAVDKAKNSIEQPESGAKYYNWFQSLEPGTFVTDKTGRVGKIVKQSVHSGGSYFKPSQRVGTEKAVLWFDGSGRSTSDPRKPIGVIADKPFHESRDATGHEHDARGRFGSGGAKGDDANNGERADGLPDVHSKAEAVVDSRSLWRKIAGLPRAIVKKSVDLVKGMYARAEEKYGSKWAKAIAATAIITMPTPFTMGSVAAMTGLAHLWTKYISGGPKPAAVTESEEQDMTPEEIEAVAAQWVEELTGHFADLKESDWDSDKMKEEVE